MKFISNRIKRPNFAAPSKNPQAAPLKTTGKLHSYVIVWSDKSQDFWQHLAPRDKLALSVLMLFFIIMVGGYGGYSMHMAAQKSKLDYQNQVADYFWLRAQAANIDTNKAHQETSQPPANQVNSVLSAMGIMGAQVVAMGNDIQLSFSHPSQAVVANTLSQLEQQGAQLSKLIIQQDATSKVLSVQATLSFS